MICLTPSCLAAMPIRMFVSELPVTATKASTLSSPSLCKNFTSRPSPCSSSVRVKKGSSCLHFSALLSISFMDFTRSSKSKHVRAPIRLPPTTIRRSTCCNDPTTRLRHASTPFWLAITYTTSPFCNSQSPFGICVSMSRSNATTRNANSPNDLSTRFSDMPQRPISDVIRKEVNTNFPSEKSMYSRPPISPSILIMVCDANFSG